MRGRVFRKFLNGTPVGGNGFIPVLVPSRTVPHVHRLVVDGTVPWHLARFLRVMNGCGGTARLALGARPWFNSWWVFDPFDP